MAHDCYSLIYMSVATAQLSKDELTRLLRQSRRFNSENGVTGLLSYANGHWIEVLEGEQKIIEELMIRIAIDSRHREVEVMEKGRATSREFLDWSMAFLDFASPEVRALPGYSTFLEEPFDWEASSEAGRGLQLLNYFKAIMLAPDDSVSNLIHSAEIQMQAPVLVGKIAAAKRKA